jgi:hypothetical protein
MPEGISLKFTGIDRVVKRNKNIYDVVENPRMSPIVSNIAKMWEVNFNTEGAMVGGWRDLTDETNKVRQARGYPPAHPILVQSGDLKRAAITSLINKGEYNESVNGDGVLMTYVAGHRQFKLNISGRKVTNQFRSQSRKRGSRNFSAPARRFWFVSPGVIAAAKDALLKDIKQRVRAA